MGGEREGKSREQGCQEACLHHFLGERKESRDGGRAQKDRGATGEEEGGVRREAEEQAGHAPQDRRGEEGVDGGQAWGGDHHGGGAGCQVPRQGRGSHEALRPLESIRNVEGHRQYLAGDEYTYVGTVTCRLGAYGMFVVCECVLEGHWCVLILLLLIPGAVCKKEFCICIGVQLSSDGWIPCFIISPFS